MGLQDRLIFFGAVTHLSGCHKLSNLKVQFLGGLSLHLNHLIP